MAQPKNSLIKNTPNNELFKLNLSDIRQHSLLKRHFLGVPLFNAINSLADTINQDDDTQAEATNREQVEMTLQRMHWMVDGFLNTGHYSEIGDEYRLLYSYVCALRAAWAYRLGEYVQALLACDEGLMKGSDLEDGRLSGFAFFLCQQMLPAPAHLPSKVKEGGDTGTPPVSLPNSVAIPCVVLPSLSQFLNEFYSPCKPVIIRGMVSEWPAFHNWSFAYLNQVCGHRTVPVEIGTKYTEEDWHQRLMTFHEYLCNYVFAEKRAEGESPLVAPQKPGYMAQHRLLDQIPELLKDIIIPDYCAFADNGCDSEDTMTFNAFIGPKGTISPLHVDPRHNFFCQIRGRKFVRLIGPEWRPQLYMFDDLMRHNTSKINVEEPDLDEFPDFSQVKCEDFLIEAGDCLFIPKGYYHHIRALEKCISLSIWFGN